MLLLLVTLFIVWFVWLIVLWLKGAGQNPGKQLVKLRVVSATTGAPADPGCSSSATFCAASSPCSSCRS